MSSFDINKITQNVTTAVDSVLSGVKSSDELPENKKALVDLIDEIIADHAAANKKLTSLKKGIAKLPEVKAKDSKKKK